MPILITEELINSTEKPEAGWSLVKFIGAREQASKNKPDNTNYYFNFEFLSGPQNSEKNKGRKETYMVFEGALPYNVGGCTDIFMQFLCALSSRTRAELKGIELNPEFFSAFIGNELYTNVKDSTRDGNIVKEFIGFTPSTLVPF